jgi:hypothetical protein
MALQRRFACRAVDSCLIFDRALVRLLSNSSRVDAVNDPRCSRRSLHGPDEPDLAASSS